MTPIPLWQDPVDPLVFWIKEPMPASARHEFNLVQAQTEKITDDNRAQVEALWNRLCAGAAEKHFRRSDVGQWLDEQSIPYLVWTAAVRETRAAFIKVPEPAHAMLLKLTWL